MNPEIANAVRQLTDTSRYVRRAAVDTLAQSDNSEVVEPLLRALSDADGLVREGTLLALRQRADVRAVGPLIQIFETDNATHHQMAWEALAQIGEPAVAPLVWALGDESQAVRRGVAEALVRIGTPAVEPLIKGLTQSGERLPRAAATVLGWLGDARAVPPLLKMAEKENTARTAAIKALGKLGDARSTALLCRLLNVSQPEIREAAQAALKTLGGDGGRLLPDRILACPGMSSAEKLDTLEFLRGRRAYPTVHIPEIRYFCQQMLSAQDPAICEGARAVLAELQKRSLLRASTAQDPSGGRTLLRPQTEQTSNAGTRDLLRGTGTPDRLPPERPGLLARLFGKAR